MNQLSIIEELNIGSHLAIPIILDDMTIAGTICATDPNPHVFTDGELESLKLLADIYTFVINQTKHRGIADEDQIRKHAKSVINELAAELADQVRNPMQTVKGFIQYLLDEPKFQQHKDVILAEFKLMEDNLHSFLLATKPAYPLKEKVSLANLLVETIADVKPQAEKNNTKISLLLEAMPELNIDKPQIKRVFFNFIKNGIEAAAENGEIKITTNSCMKDMVSIEIIDNGHGIDLDELTKIGKPLYSTKAEGHGLGIAVASEIIKAHKGKLVLESNELGTTVSIHLPL